MLIGHTYTIIRMHLSILSNRNTIRVSSVSIVTQGHTILLSSNFTITPLHCTYFHSIPTESLFASRTLSLKVFNLQRKDAGTPAGKRFQSFVVLFIKEYLPASVLYGI
jgi:hypothetical protein